MYPLTIYWAVPLHAPLGTDILGLTEVGFNSSDFKAPTLKQKEQIKSIVEAILEKND